MTTKDSIESIKAQLQQFSNDQITLSLNNTETEDISFKFDVEKEEE